MHNLKHDGETQSPLLLSLKQAAQALSLSERTVWSMVQTAELPHLRVGRRLLFSRAALEAWIEKHQAGGGAHDRAIG